MRVFVLDDSDIALDALRIAFEAVGHTVIARSMALGTISAIKRAQPDVVIVDVRMPLLDGPTLIRLLRSNRQNDHMLLILYSGLHAHELAKVARDCGADAWLSKGFSAEDLVMLVEQLASPPPPPDSGDDAA